MPYRYLLIQLVLLVGEGSCYEGGLDEDNIFAYFCGCMNGSTHVLKLPTERDQIRDKL